MANPDPSPETRFQPGISGNPGGKPKTKPLTEALRRILDAPDPITLSPANGAERLMQALYLAGSTGDVGAIREAWNRIEGKVPEPVVEPVQEAKTSLVKDLSPGDDGLADRDSDLAQEADGPPSPVLGE